jgi:hypothetical protein
MVLSKSEVITNMAKAFASRPPITRATAASGDASFASDGDADNALTYLEQEPSLPDFSPPEQHHERPSEGGIDHVRSDLESEEDSWGEPAMHLGFCETAQHEQPTLERQLRCHLPAEDDEFIARLGRRADHLARNQGRLRSSTRVEHASGGVCREAEAAPVSPPSIAPALIDSLQMVHGMCDDTLAAVRALEAASGQQQPP